MHAKQIVERVGVFRFLAMFDQAKLEFFGGLILAWRQLHRFPQTRGRLLQVSLHLPGCSQIGSQVKVFRMGPQGGSQTANGFAGFAQSQVEGSQVSRFIRR